MRVLIVDDDMTTRRLMLAYFGKQFDCDVASNGTEAIEVMGRALSDGKPYDLLCLDIAMPGMDGQEALKHIRELEREHGIKSLDGVKVIMTTAFSDKENVISAFRTGCEAYIVKPVSRAKLFAEMDKLGLMPVESA
ncbi:MAG: response regulator [Sedimentisphaerales bacterium]|nr:response regulator [Sedimentisphaerales bacterium]